MTTGDRQHDHTPHGYVDLNPIQQLFLLLFLGWPLWFVVGGLSLGASIGLKFAGLIDEIGVVYWPLAVVLMAAFLVWLHRDAKREWT